MIIMRRLKLLFTLCALALGIGQTRAQEDVTNTYITNADLSSTEGWIENVSGQYRDYGNGLIGDYTVRFSPATVDESHLSTEYCFGLECRWASNYASYQQTTGTLSVGVYTLTYDVENVNGSTKSVVYDNLFYVEQNDTKYGDTSTEWMKGQSSWTTHSISFTVEEPTAVTISFGYGTGTNNLSADVTPALYVSHVKLTYQSLIDGVKALWQEAESNAEAALADADYANITGQERTDLTTWLANANPSTKEEYIQATEELNGYLTTVFIPAKASYDALAAAKSMEAPALAYASSEALSAFTTAQSATATTASEADEITADIMTALRAYYESHALAESVSGAVDMTSRIANANAEDGNNGWTWTGNKNNPRNTESWTSADGTNDHMYFDGGNWSGSNWTTTMKQNVTLPAGMYLLTAKGRASANVTLTLSVGENSVELPNVGSNGNVFDRGWCDGSVEFTADGGDVEILVTATAEPTHEWFSIGDFRLMRLQLYADLATASDYAAMDAALAAASTKPLGFDAGQYAPYTNVEALKAMALAETLDTSDENSRSDVEAITSAMADGNWTANATDLDAIYDGCFANTEANSTSGDIDLPGWTKVEGLRLLVKDEGTDPGLAYTDGHAAVFAWGGTTLTYGEQPGYTLPMGQHSVYELTLKLSGWRDGDMPTVVTVTLDEDARSLNAPAVSPINNAEGNPFASAKLHFVPTADNSILKIYANHHYTIADLSMVKTADIAVDVADLGWRSFFCDIDVDFTDSGLTPYAPTTDGSTIQLTAIEGNVVPANTGVLLATTDGSTTAATYHAQPAAENVAEAISNLAGVLVDTRAAAGIFVLQNGENGLGFYRTYDELATIGANTAYLPADIVTEDITFLALDPITTGIGTTLVNKGEKNKDVYDLQGRRVNSSPVALHSSLKKGVYITDGKKMVVR